MQKRHNPLTFYMRELLYVVLALLVRLVALAPLAFLFAFPAGSHWRYLAALCPLLMIFVVLPLRFSFAEAMVQKPRQRFFSFDSAMSMSMYGEKLGESLLHALNVLKWGIPFLLMAGGCYYLYSIADNSVDVMTMLGELGKGVVNVWNSVANFFINLFGSVKTLTYQGGMTEGLYTVGAVLGAGLLFWIYGAVRNSSTRYIWVLATRAERSPRVEIRRRLRGRRWRQFLVGLINLVLWSPFILVLCLTLKDVITDVSGKLMMALSQKQLPAVDFIPAIKPTAFAFLCLYFPLLPARRWITATFSSHDARHIAPEQPDDTTPVDTEGEPYAHNAPSPFHDLGGDSAHGTADAQAQAKPAAFEAAAESAHEPTPMAGEEQTEYEVPEEPYTAQPVAEPMEHYAAQPIEQPVEPYAAQPVVEPVEHYAAQPVVEPVEHYAAQPIEQPVEPYAAQPVAEPVEQQADADEDVGYKPYDPSDAEAPPSPDSEQQPFGINRASEPSEEDNAPPANDPPTFTLGQ